MPAGMLTSPNITFDKETGIGSRTKELFIAKFAAYRDSANSLRAINIMTDPSTIMPWPAYAGMTDQDLGAIYEYVRSRALIKHDFVRFKKTVAKL